MAILLLEGKGNEQALETRLDYYNHMDSYCLRNHSYMDHDRKGLVRRMTNETIIYLIFSFWYALTVTLGYPIFLTLIGKMLK